MGQIKMAKGWRRWLMIVFIIGLLVLAVIAFTGCSSKTSGSTTTTPIGQLQANVSQLSGRLDTVSQTSWDAANQAAAASTLANSLQTTVQGYGERIANLEARNCSCNTTTTATCDLSSLNASISGLAMRVTELEAWRTSIPAPTATLTVNATATSSGNIPPVVNKMEASPSVFNKSDAYWSFISCNATDANGDMLTYTWFAINGSFENNGYSFVYWIPPSFDYNGNISVIVNDGKGGITSSTLPIRYNSSR